MRSKKEIKGQVEIMIDMHNKLSLVHVPGREHEYKLETLQRGIALLNWVLKDDAVEL
jgi:hypothetical protein